MTMGTGTTKIDQVVKVGEATQWNAKEEFYEDEEKLLADIKKSSQNLPLLNVDVEITFRNRGSFIARAVDYFHGTKLGRKYKKPNPQGVKTHRFKFMEIDFSVKRNKVNFFKIGELDNEK